VQKLQGKVRCRHGQEIYFQELLQKLHKKIQISKEEIKMVEGTVKFFNSMKHFGFIAGDDGKEYFVHSSGLKAGTSITEGDKVSFNPAQGDRGLKAEEVEKV